MVLYRLIAQKKRKKVDKILYIENIEKGYVNPYWDIRKEVEELVDIVADSNRCTRHY